jgi:hypothetical protein
MPLGHPHTLLAGSSLDPTTPVVLAAGAVRVQILHCVLLARAKAGNILHYPFPEDRKVQPVQSGTEHHIQPPAAEALPPVQVCSLHKRLLSGCTLLFESQVHIATRSLWQALHEWYCFGVDAITLCAGAHSCRGCCRTRSRLRCFQKPTTAQRQVGPHAYCATGRCQSASDAWSL